MRTAWTWSVIGLALLAAQAPGQSPRDKVAFQNVRIGFTPGPHANNQDEAQVSFRQPLYKPGAWVPVYVQVLNSGKYDPDPREDGAAVVIVETLDSDDAQNSYRVPLAAIKPGETDSVVAYTRPGSRYTDFVVRVYSPKRDRDLCAPHRVSYPGLDSAQVMYLALGSRLPGLKLPGAPGNPQTHQGAVSEIGLLTDVRDLPTLWFGYNAADLVILTTSDRTFTTNLVNENAGLKAALAEWVRRGGKLLVCAGKNADLLAGLGELQALLPVEVGAAKPYQVAAFKPSWKDFGVGLDPLPLAAPTEFPKVSPRENRSARVLVDGPPESGGSPFVVQGAYGLGRVTVVAADLDKDPFTKWSSQGSFWEQLLARSGPRVPSNVQVNQFGFRMPRGAVNMEDTDGTLKNLVHGLENFEGVPVISFGWVALFILLYILVVGPIDYLFLKKVVKRLELTWITFPTVVIAVSAAAYFTAYALKGNDLRLNKIDVVDVDLHTRQSYGRAWLSVFSPRIQNYTIAVEPAEGWAAAPEDGSGPNAVVSWFGAPKQGQRSLFRRSYEYEPKATALRGVPIQVWSTKNFEARWQAGFPKDRPPFAAALRHPPGRPDELIGEVTNQLPADLEDVILIYKGEVASLGRLLPNSERQVTARGRLKFSSWRDGAAAVGEPGAEGGEAPAADSARSNLPMSLLFHEEMNAGRGDPHNGALRDVDQSWRVAPDNRDEAILVGRVATTHGKAEDVTRGPASACRLWLGDLPTSGRPRPLIPGDMRQDTYVRVYIPIAPAAK